MRKTIFFDLDNTLYSFDHTSALADQAVGLYCERQFGIDREQAIRETYESMNEITARMGERNSAVHDRLIRFKNVLLKHGWPVFPHAGEMYELYWGTLTDAMVPEPGVYAFLHELKKEGFRLFCATNMTSRIQYRKIRKLGMGSLFTDLITSEEACAEKPQKEFFEYCADAALEKPEACIYVGDNYRLDVLGSRQAGMKSIHYQTPDLALRHRKAEPGTPVITDYRDLDTCMKIVRAVACDGLIS
ncbi:MAG: HAD family hydrolase [Eubacteriales bacterium]|jgi:putative hydrolase of the HAD superfamily